VSVAPNSIAFSHGFVAEDPPVGDRGDVAVQDVQVGAADRGGVDPDDDVGRFPHGGVRDVLPGLVARTVVDECLHLVPPLVACRTRLRRR
jgi:hypothetical protein